CRSPCESPLPRTIQTKKPVHHCRKSQKRLACDHLCPPSGSLYRSSVWRLESCGCLKDEGGLAFVRESTNPSEGCQANFAAGVCCMQVTIESKDDSCTVTLFLLISLISLGSDGWLQWSPEHATHRTKPLEDLCLIFSFPHIRSAARLSVSLPKRSKMAATCSISRARAPGSNQVTRTAGSASGCVGKKKSNINPPKVLSDGWHVQASHCNHPSDPSEIKEISRNKVTVQESSLLSIVTCMQQTPAAKLA